MKIDWKKPVALVLVLVGLWFANSQTNGVPAEEEVGVDTNRTPAPRLTEPLRGERSGDFRARERSRAEEEILAFEQAGGTPSQALVNAFRRSLDGITRQCNWSRREASDKLLKMHQMLRQDGERVELLDLSNGLDRATREVKVDCHSVLATLGVMLAEG